jgi:hypothetical protein
MFQWWWWVIIDHALAYLHGRVDGCVTDNDPHKNGVNCWLLSHCKRQVTFPSYKLNHVVVELLICWLEHQSWSVVELQSISLPFAIRPPSSNLHFVNWKQYPETCSVASHCLLSHCLHFGICLGHQGRVWTCSDFSWSSSMHVSMSVLCAQQTNKTRSGAGAPDLACFQEKTIRMWALPLVQGWITEALTSCLCKLTR